MAEGLTVGDVARHYGTLGRTRGLAPVVTSSTALSWAEIDDRASRLANVLRGRGLQPGGKVAVLLWNHPAYFEIIFGVARVGGVIVPLNARLVAREIGYCLNHSDAEMLITASSFIETVKQALPDDRRLAMTILVMGDDRPLGLDYEALIQESSGQPPDVAVHCDEPFWIGFTSGTTGPPKAVLVTHRQLVETWNALVLELSLTRDDSILLAAPIFGGIGFMFGLASIYAGGRTVLLEQFDPALALELIERHRVTIIPVPPTMFTMLIDTPGSANYDMSAVRVVLSLGAALRSATRQRLEKFFPAGGVYDFYGSTELGVVTALHPVDQHRKECSVGQPFTGVQVRLLDDEGLDVAPGEVGEIYKQGVVLSGHYYKNSEATADIHRGDWVTSHDLGRFDEEGYLYLVDRKKDMIVTGGMNVYPSEVEEILAQHPAVALAAVIGVPDPLWGERVTAFVVPRPGEHLDAGDVLAGCREHLADYKRPKVIEIVDSLPMTPAGKVLKRALRERFGSEQEERNAGLHP